MGITKFTSFVVFFFGIVILLIVGGTMVQRMSVTKEEKAARIKQRTSDLPQCDLPALNLGAQEQFTQKLDKLYETGGVQSVRSYVESAFVPGRVIILPATLPGERAAEHVLLDREMRRCDSQGVAVIEQAPVLPRAVAHLRLGDDSTIHTWRRLELPQPFYINVWWVPRNG